MLQFISCQIWLKKNLFLKGKQQLEVYKKSVMIIAKYSPAKWRNIILWLNCAVDPHFRVSHLHWPKMYLETNKSLHYIFHVIYCKERCTSANLWAAKPIDLVLKMKTISIMFDEHVLNHTSTKTPADSKTVKLRKWRREVTPVKKKRCFLIMHPNIFGCYCMYDHCVYIANLYGYPLFRWAVTLYFLK